MLSATYFKIGDLGAKEIWHEDNECVGTADRRNSGSKVVVHMFGVEVVATANIDCAAALRVVA